MCVFEVFITAVPIIKLFAWGEGDSGGHVLRETTSRDTVGSESLTCRWPPGPERPLARHAGSDPPGRLCVPRFCYFQSFEEPTRAKQGNKMRRLEYRILYRVEDSRRRTREGAEVWFH